MIDPRGPPTTAGPGMYAVGSFPLQPTPPVVRVLSLVECLITLGQFDLLWQQSIYLCSPPRSFFFFLFLTLSLSSFWTSRGHRCRPFFSRFLASIFIAHGVQQSHCSSMFHRVLLILALALSASQFVHKKKSQRIYTSKHSAGLEATKLTYTRLEDNLIRHRGDR